MQFHKDSTVGLTLTHFGCPFKSTVKPARFLDVLGFVGRAFLSQSPLDRTYWSRLCAIPGLFSFGSTGFPFLWGKTKVYCTRLLATVSVKFSKTIYLHLVLTICVEESVWRASETWVWTGAASTGAMARHKSTNRILFEIMLLISGPLDVKLQK